MTDPTPGVDPYGATGTTGATAAPAYGPSEGTYSAESADHAPGQISSVGAIIGNISADLSTLIRQEVEGSSPMSVG